MKFNQRRIRAPVKSDHMRAGLFLSETTILKDSSSTTASMMPLMNGLANGSKPTAQVTGQSRTAPELAISGHSAFRRPTPLEIRLGDLASFQKRSGTHRRFSIPILIFGRK
jgi:hypothetical protein